MNPPTNETKEVPPELVRRYTIVFLLSTLLGGAMVFLSVAGRRQALIDEEKARRAAAGGQAKTEQKPLPVTPSPAVASPQP